MSDNSTTFRGTDRDLCDAIRLPALADNFTAFIHAEEVNWKFIPPYATHFGKLWEAGVKSVKHHVRRVGREQTLTFEEMTTLSCLIEACFNSRPLIAPSIDTDDYDALTLGHFLIDAPLLSLPLSVPESAPVSLLTRW